MYAIDTNIISYLLKKGVQVNQRMIEAIKTRLNF